MSRTWSTDDGRQQPNSNYEHEIIGIDVGLTAAEVAGLPVSFEDPRRQAVYEVVAALIGGRRLPRGVFDRAIALLGHAGLNDIAVLIGYFTCVSLTLIAYDVPADAVGLAR